MLSAVFFPTSCPTEQTADISGPSPALRHTVRSSGDAWAWHLLPHSERICFLHHARVLAPNDKMALAERQLHCLEQQYFMLGINNYLRLQRELELIRSRAGGRAVTRQARLLSDGQDWSACCERRFDELCEERGEHGFNPPAPQPDRAPGSAPSPDPRRGSSGSVGRRSRAIYAAAQSTLFSHRMETICAGTACGRLLRPSAEHSRRMKSACLLLLLVSACWALPFRQSGFLDFMMEDEVGSGVPDAMAPMPPMPPDMPVCPFRCQCHLRVIQCSDLGLKSVPDKIPSDTTLLDLQNNKITEIKENDFKVLKGLHALILVNNKISIIHAKAFMPLAKLQRLYLSKNQLKDMPNNMPKSLQELRIHENQISKIKKASFEGLLNVIVMELGSNPLKSSGIDDGAFADLRRVSYIRIADTNLTEIPKGLPSSLSELHLDSNKITKVQAERLLGLKHLAKLGLSDNEISLVENGTMANVPHLRELHLDNNVLTTVPRACPTTSTYRWSISITTRSLRWGRRTSARPGSTPRRPCTQGSACSATPCPTGRCSPSPSAASSTAPPSSSETTGRSRPPQPPAPLPPLPPAPLPTDQTTTLYHCVPPPPDLVVCTKQNNPLQ
ncbi:hypothetical protein COCON_G00228450 [Conger conger]|uniref:Decorin n=1 Tax=Conger conger TaxID=82655 RepID=A0A9Q1CUS3_CONCO|nr:hypothetical protein COCON_G00228450 [Conger conger]